MSLFLPTRLRDDPVKAKGDIESAAEFAPYYALFLVVCGIAIIIHFEKLAGKLKRELNDEQINNADHPLD